MSSESSAMPICAVPGWPALGGVTAVTLKVASEPAGITAPLGEREVSATVAMKLSPG
jgi:hypothetical protein